LEPVHLSLLDPEKLQKEISRLELLLQSSDTVYTKKEIFGKLFDCYVDIHNNEPLYKRAIAIADTLEKQQDSERMRGYYLNWKNILEKYLALMSSNDSYAYMIEKMSGEIKNLRNSSRKQIKQIDNSMNATIDSLSVIIRKQKETINKLQDLDLKIEQQRSRIK
jgi:hypothetical protein